MKKTVACKEAFLFGWRSFQQHWKFLLTCLGVLMFLSMLSDYLVGRYFKDIEPTASILSMLFSLTIIFLYFNFVRSLVRIVDGKTPVWQDIFVYHHGLWAYFFGLCLYSIVTFVGLLLFLIPGIYFSLRYGQYVYVIADRNLSVFDAFRESVRLTSGVKWQLLLTNLLASLGLMAGALLLGVGLLVALPVVQVALAFVYRSLTEQASASRLATAPLDQASIARSETKAFEQKT